MKTYLLSDTGKQCEWQVWKHLGGCGLSDFTRNECGRIEPKTTLGELQTRCIVAGRETARFAVDHLGLKDWAVVEYDQPETSKSIVWRDGRWTSKITTP
jgi:hypothetical protein